MSVEPDQSSLQRTLGSGVAAPRRLTITVQDNYLSAYAHALEADGSESATGYGLQGSPRAEITEGTLQLVEDFLSDEKWAESSHPAKELDGC